MSVQIGEQIAESGPEPVEDRCQEKKPGLPSEHSPSSFGVKLPIMH
jgi:hypothetical protein